MSKFVSIAEEHEFIRLSGEVKIATGKLDKLKEKFRDLFDKGFLFKLLIPRPSEGRFSPPWKDVAYALAEHYMSKKEIKEWERKLLKDYPPTPVATAFILPKQQEV